MKQSKFFPVTLFIVAALNFVAQAAPESTVPKTASSAKYQLTVDRRMEASPLDVFLFSEQAGERAAHQVLGLLFIPAFPIALESMVADSVVVPVRKLVNHLSLALSPKSLSLNVFGRRQTSAHASAQVSASPSALQSSSEKTPKNVSSVKSKRRAVCSGADTITQ